MTLCIPDDAARPGKTRGITTRARPVAVVVGRASVDAMATPATATTPATAGVAGVARAARGRRRATTGTTTTTGTATTTRRTTARRRGRVARASTRDAIAATVKTGTRSGAGRATRARAREEAGRRARARTRAASANEGTDGRTLNARRELRALMGFCAPLLASNLISPLLTMTDTAFVGRCAGEASAVALAALGVSTPLTDYSVSLFAFITAGLTSIVSRGVASGEDEDELNGKVYGALFIAGASSLAVGALLLARTDALLDLLSVTGEVKTIAAGYTRIRGLAMPAAFLTASAYATLVARKDTVGPLLCVALAAVVNFVGDYLMVAVFKTGAAGAAWATTASLYTGLIAITVLLHRRGLLKFPPRQNFGDGSRSFLRAMIPTKAQMAPTMAFFGPITFLVAALLAIYTTQILQANSLGVTVSAAHRIAATLFSFTVLCGDPLVQAGQAFMPEHIITPSKANARKMAMILFQFGLFTAATCSSGFAACCYLCAGVFTTDAAVIAQLHSVVLPMSAAVSANIISKSLYGVMVAARALNFLAGLTAIGLLGFGAAMSYLNTHVFGLAKYSYIWWITFAYYGLASFILFCRINGIAFKSILRDDRVDAASKERSSAS